MNKFLACLIICFLGLVLISEVKAEDPVSPEQRVWLNKHVPIRIGVFNYYPPFGFVDESNEPMGMGIDFCRLLSSKLNCWIQFYPVLFEDQLDGLKNGQYDTLSGVFPLKERRKFFDFSKPYSIIKTSIYVKKKYSHLKGVQELKGLKVSAVEGDSGQVVARKAGLNPFPVATYREAIFDLANGDTDVIIMDELVVTYFAKKFNLQDKIIKIGQPVYEGNVTLPVSKGNTVLLDILNKGIDMVSQDEWEKIVNRWL